MIKNINSFKYSNNGEIFLANFQATTDGSYSLQLIKNDCELELMHSKSGAFSETIYVYLPVVEFVLNYNLKPVFLSIGLGLGYIEIMTVAFIISKYPECLKNCSLTIFSFESEKILISLFKSYFLNNEIPEIFKQCYDNIIKLNCEFFSVQSEFLKSEVKNLILNHKIIFNIKYQADSTINFPAAGIFFDAFSVNTSPDLWSLEVLNSILSEKNCSKQAVFATYASKAVLKKY